MCTVHCRLITASQIHKYQANISSMHVVGLQQPINSTTARPSGWLVATASHQVPGTADMAMPGVAIDNRCQLVYRDTYRDLQGCLKHSVYGIPRLRITNIVANILIVPSASSYL